MPVSKTDFVRGLQCEKMLWLDTHRPELKMIPPQVQQRLDEGNEFGDKAMGLFGEFFETTTFKADGRLDFAAMLEKTKTWLAEGKSVICEGAFSWYGNFCAADILRRDGDGYALYEVKNAPSPRDEFITDLGFQRLIIRKCGVKITACHLVLQGDNGEAYKTVDVTAAARNAERVASARIFELGKIKKKDAAQPDIGVGQHCETPYRCWYYEYCHGCGKENITDFDKI
jgi:hypothetical protein